MSWFIVLASALLLIPILVMAPMRDVVALKIKLVESLARRRADRI
jgi:hypothetical protein